MILLFGVNVSYVRGSPAEHVCTLQALYLLEPQPLACALKLARQALYLACALKLARLAGSKGICTFILAEGEEYCSLGAPSGPNFSNRIVMWFSSSILIAGH